MVFARVVACAPPAGTAKSRRQAIAIWFTAPFSATLTTPARALYLVNLFSRATFVALGDIKVGDEVGVMGEVSGTTVAAKHIMDGVPPRPQGPPSDN